MILNQFDLICLDFDGLLADTEPLHYKAYKTMVENEGGQLDVDFATYCQLAHSPNRGSLANFVYQHNPHLNPDWKALREKKLLLYRELLPTENIKPMPFAIDLVEKMLKEGKKLAIVTNSPRIDVEIIARTNPFLTRIEKWITVEDHHKPKPKPDGYLLAMEHYACPPEKTCGLDDTMKGVDAMKAASVFPILVSTLIEHKPELHHLSTLELLIS